MMKRILMVMMLMMSFKAFSYVCTSDENPAKKLDIQVTQLEFVQAQTYARATYNVFAGKLTDKNWFLDTYTLYNQDGVEYSLIISKETGVLHCRARVCPTLPESITAKLSSLGIEDEYFSCTL